MDASNNTILGGLAIAISVITTVVGVINHRRLRSKCCGRKIEMEIEIDSTVRPPLTSIAPATPATPPAKPKQEV